MELELEFEELFELELDELFELEFEELLFATATDFEERHNLIGIDSLKPVLERTRRYLSTRLSQDWAPSIH